MSLDRVIEEMIRAAMARGEFDNLPGKGKPLNLDDYFDSPEDVRAAHQLLKDSGFVPEEVQLLKDIAALKEQLSLTTGDETASRIRKAIDDKTLAFNVVMDRRRANRRSRSR
jgi:hypothetical protein